VTTTESVLVVAAHPDDEVLGCGGAMARHRQAGDRVAVLILADGITSRGGGDAEARIGERRQAAQDANAILGVTDVTLLSYPDNRMDAVALLDVAQEIERVMARCRPTVVYTHHAGDVNVDHTRTHEAVLAACRPQPGQTVRRLLFFETPSSTEWRPPGSAAIFAPNWFVDIGGTLEAKLKAVAAYHAELREFPHPRSLAAIEHLARWRGASAGLAAAEAFALGRQVVA
jgi:LmbE family N-acetylglucosaminyl deacetylase